MKKVLMLCGEIREVSESYGRRLMEQGKAIPAPEEEPEEEKKDEKPEAEAGEAEEEKTSRKARKK